MDPLGEFELDPAADCADRRPRIHVCCSRGWIPSPCPSTAPAVPVTMAPGVARLCWALMAALLVLQAAPCDAGTYPGAYPASVTGFYTDNAAQQTVLLDAPISPRHKKVIRNEILRLLGLDHKPQAPRSASVRQTSAPQYMLELYRSLGGQGPPPPGHNLTGPAGLGDQVGSADLIMGFVNQAAFHQLFSDGGRRFYFDFSGVKSTEGATGASLRLYKFTTPWLADRGPFTIQLFKIRNDRYRQETVLEQASTYTVHALAEGWLDVNATAALRHWVLEAEEQVLMYLEVTDANGVDLEPSSIGLVDNSGPRDKQAFLLACFKAKHKLHARRSRGLEKVGRVRRSPSPSNYYSDEKDYGWKYPPDRPSRRACQRRQLYVSFRELGWADWIIAPEGYPAFYCDGECNFPLNAHMNATNHAIVQALVHMMKPFLAPNPCCAPTTLHGISFLYLDYSYNVVLKNYRNMVVQACGCH